ncbi:MAG: hydantoinase/oxoprolinase family protein, partial [Hyphomicrobiales bacterium]
ILSGPAASLVGAPWLSETENALISDIGGTTTDYAFLRGSRPGIDPEGATVGGWKTMVEAVAMRTIGLGGDSEVRVVPTGLKSELHLGPKRHIPLSLLALESPEIVHGTLDKQLRAPRHDEHFGLFAKAVGRSSAHDSALSDNEKALIEALGSSVVPLNQLLASRKNKSALDRLVGRGLVMICGATPSDAAHVLGKYKEWDGEAARKGLALLARQQTNAGAYVCENAETAAKWIVETLIATSAETLLAACLREDGIKDDGVPALLLAQNKIAGGEQTVNIGFDLSLPVVGLGAPASTYYRDVAERLAAEAIIPPYAHVANAVGAVVGHVRVTLTAEITQPEPGRFQVVAAHQQGAPGLFGNLDKAIDFASNILKQEAEARAIQAGAGELSISEKRTDKTAIMEGKETLVECVYQVSASGRPRLAEGP